MFYKIRSSCAL